MGRFEGSSSLGAPTYSYRATSIEKLAPGDYTFIITAALTDGGGSVDTSFTMTFVDPCHSPDAKVISRALTNPDRYIYSKNLMEYEIAPLQTEPANCPVVYTCAVTAGARTDLCDVEVGTTLYSRFEDLTLKFRALSEDSAPSGNYAFAITAQIVGGSATGAVSFMLTVWNPCPNAALQLHPDNSLPDLVYYYLDDSIRLPY